MLLTDHDGRQVEAWQLPPFGAAALENVPSWLVLNLTERAFEITDIGGLRDRRDVDTPKLALPGDFVVRYKDGKTLFCSHTTFTSSYHVS